MSLPTINEIIAKSESRSGRQELINTFRTESGLSIEEALAKRTALVEALDAEVGAFIEQIDVAVEEALANSNYSLEDDLYDLRTAAVATYGFDNYEDGEWITSY